MQQSGFVYKVNVNKDSRKAGYGGSIVNQYLQKQGFTKKTDCQVCKELFQRIGHGGVIKTTPLSVIRKNSI